MRTCSRCNRRIGFAQRWTSPQWVVCEVEFEPDKHYRESFVEVEPGVFVSVFRHDCESQLKEQPKYKPLNQVFRGSKTYPRRKAQPELFGDA